MIDIYTIDQIRQSAENAQNHMTYSALRPQAPRYERPALELPLPSSDRREEPEHQSPSYVEIESSIDLIRDNDRPRQPQDEPRRVIIIEL